MPNTENIEVRPGLSSESDQIFDMLKAYAIYDGSLSGLKATPDSLRAQIFGPNPMLFAEVAEHNGRLIGLMLYYYSFSSWQMKKCFWIEDLFVQDDYRGRGVGRLFLERSKEIALQQDCARVDWHVRTENHAARGFYEHMGAKIDPDTMPVYWKV